jgi:hypothetical protein
MSAFTYLDKALLVSEWAEGSCPVCRNPNFNWSGPKGAHKPNCYMDLALAERGFTSQEQRDLARQSIKG